VNTSLALLLLALAASPPVAERRVLDRVAATVNGDVVTLAELTRRAGSEWERVESLPAGPAKEKARAEALRRAFDQVVAEKLLDAQARVLDVEATDTQIDAAIGEIKQRNGFSDEQLDRALEEQGLDRAAFRKQIKRELQTFSVLQYKVRSRVKASDEDLRAYYEGHPQEFAGDEEVHVRHIFLPLPEDANAAETARVQAEGQRVLQRLKTGESFAKLAKELSKGPSAEDGGDLGWLRRGTVQKSLEDAAFALKDGQISGIVRAGPGLHILEVEGHRRGGAKTFDEAKDEIRNRLMEQQAESYRQQYVAELKKDAIIDAKIPELKQQLAQQP
jgi:peptidyl-prolyl cis-trans isomerase SurA